MGESEAREVGEKLVLMEKMVWTVLMEFLGSLGKRGKTLLKFLTGMTQQQLTRSMPSQESRK